MCEILSNNKISTLLQQLAIYIGSIIVKHHIKCIFWQKTNKNILSDSLDVFP